MFELKQDKHTYIGPVIGISF